jgi:CRP/FNR family transcriptional regulator, nitrogen fixation regulation protein
VSEQGPQRQIHRKQEAMLTHTALRPTASLKVMPANEPAFHGPVPAKSALGTIEMMGAQMKFAANEKIFGEDEPADYIYKVVSGAVRTYKIMSDGRRQIGSFYLPGDIFGLATGKVHRFSAEAIGKTQVRLVKRSAVVGLAERDCEAARELWAFTARELVRVQEHMLLLIKSAHQRVASFLLEMSKRLAAADAVELPMSRQDIADYLGLTIETVSRTMTQLVSDAAISLPTSRRIVLRSRGALRQLNCGQPTGPISGPASEACMAEPAASPKQDREQPICAPSAILALPAQRSSAARSRAQRLGQWQVIDAVCRDLDDQPGN